MAVRRCVIAILLILSACTQPLVWEDFVRSENRTVEGYEFSVDFSDSTSFYDISFYTSPSGVIESPAALPLQVRWTSPSGKEFVEDVCMVLSSENGVRQMYRKAAAPSEPGIWTLLLAPGEDAVPITGLGIITERNGTR